MLSLLDEAPARMLATWKKARSYLRFVLFVGRHPMDATVTVNATVNEIATCVNVNSASEGEPVVEDAIEASKSAEPKAVELPRPVEVTKPITPPSPVDLPAEPIAVDAPVEEPTAATTQSAPTVEEPAPEPAVAEATLPKVEETTPEVVTQPAAPVAEVVSEPSAPEPKVDVDNDVEMADAEAATALPAPTVETVAKPDAQTQASEDVEMADAVAEKQPAPTISLDEPKTSTDLPTAPASEAGASRKPSVDNGGITFDDSPALSPQSPVTTVLRERRTVDRPSRTRALRQPRLGTKLKSDSARATPDAPPTPREADDEAMPPPSDAPDGDEEVEVMEIDEREAVLVAGVKAALGKPASCEKTVEDILSWNQEAAPTESSRVPKVGNFHADQLIADIVRPMAAEQAPTANIVARVVVRENHELKEKVTYLQEEYLELDQLWAEHREMLDKTMEKRGPPPADLYAVPGSVLPPPTPGIVPATPIAEEPSYSGRSNRRRGVGDAVATEAEYQAILAGLADSAAKDPTHRATKTAATIPDMILDKERDFRYEDENNRVDDPLAFYNFAGNAEAIWTEEEREKFLRRYLQYPKLFGKIAEGLPNKTAGDCVLYYYRTKYENDYKTLLATRRGAKARRAAVAKKKSSALMADLERNKQSTPTPKGSRNRDREGSASTTATQQGGGRNKRARQGSDMPATPGADAPARKRRPEGEPDVESATPSRAESEAPSTASKTKSRSGGDKSRAKGTKRARVNKDAVENPAPTEAVEVAPVPQSPVVQPTTAPVVVQEVAPPPVAVTDSSSATQVVDPATGLVVDAVPLLPPVKRARRKKVVEPVDPNAPPPDPNAPPPPPGEGGKPRRTTTNSYWSVAEKQKFPELVREHGADFRAIADKLGNTKTVIQVRNHYNQTVDAMRASGIVLPASTQVGVQPVKVNGVEAARETKPVIPTPTPSTEQQQQPPPTQQQQQQPQQGYPGRYPPPPGYDSFPPGPRRTSHEYPEPRRDSFPTEPRMAVFPPSPPHHSARVPSPPAPVSRSGGMRISALLNDDPPKDTKPFDTASVVSDGTVDEFDGPAQRRPSPLPAGAYGSYEQHPRRPAFEDRPPSFERGRSYDDRHPSFERGRSFERDHHGSYERGRSFERRPSFDHVDERYQRQYGYPPSSTPGTRHWQQREGPPPPGAYYPPPHSSAAPAPSARGGPHWDPAGMPSLGVFPPNGSGHPPGAPIHVHSGAPPRPGDYGRQSDWRPYLHAPNGTAAGGHEAPTARGLSPSRGYAHRGSGSHDHPAQR
ncbi:putative protein [Vanrija pseudolonga]|uniref:Purtative protein n=1 Tax=Vanrija pseudolonga TaxID=143232 RepID=A0AAF0XZ39_9TREE|nr:purtative protein [Vanrija pseudolonga]